MKKLTLVLVVIALSVTMFSCGSDNSQQKATSSQETKIKKNEKQSLAGVYVCSEHWNDVLVGQAKMIFKGDSVSLAGISSTTYRIKGDSLFIDMHKYEMGFIISGNKLTTSGPAGKVSYTKK